VEALDFDIFAGGHGALATKADVTANRVFFRRTRRVRLGWHGSGKSLEELQKSLLFEKYKDWNGYAARRAATIDSAYRNLQLYK
jgi:hypothetical protein